MPGSRSATQSQRMMNHPDLQPPARVPSSKAALSSKLGGYSTKAPAVDGLAISYDATEQSSYQPEQPLQNDSDYRENDRPIPRHKSNNTNGFLAAFDPATGQSTRVDSVFDAYADMYGDAFASDGDHGDAVDDYYDAPQAAQEEPGYAAEEPELGRYEDQPQKREPWDTRGKNGLYGGGGRGADDRETGWVSDYAMDNKSGERSRNGSGAGVEEDLRYGDEQDETTRTHRNDSHDTYHGRRRSSSGTEKSSYGPITPVSAHFHGNAPVAYADSGYRSTSSPPSARYRPEEKHRAAPKPHFVNPPPLPVERKLSEEHRAAPAEPRRIERKMSNGAPVPVEGRLQKKVPQNKPPTMTVAPPTPTPVYEVDTTLLNTTPRRKSNFKWSGRSKKMPNISAPILPDGFVESLGMETFALTPGCSAPVHNGPILSRPSSDVRSTSGAESDSVSSHQPQPQPTHKKEREPAPRPRKIPNRPTLLPALKLGTPTLNVPLALDDTSTTSTPPESALPTPVRLPLDALRETKAGTRQSEYNSDITDAFRRLSRESVVSYAGSSKTLASAEKTRRLYFNGIREERARQASEEVQANRAPVLANAPPIPPLPTRANHDDYVASPASQSNFVSTPQSAKTTTSGDFRNPWGAGGGTPTSGNPQFTPSSSRSAFGHRSQQSHSSSRTMDGRRYSVARTSIPIPEQEPMSPPVVPEEHRGSTSSAYSQDQSVVDDYLSPDLDDSYSSPPPIPSVTAPLRKNSVAATNNAPFYSSNSASMGVAPLNLGRRPSHDYRNAGAGFGGSVVWGSAQGPPSTKTSSTGKSGGSSPAESLRAPTGSASTIGTTGFRNPFG